MNFRSPLHRRVGIVLTTSAIVLLAIAAQASDHQRDFTEEFHQSYSLSPDGRVELDNVNGAVHISTWDQNQVKVDAVKYAGTKEKLDEARIEVDAHTDRVSIRTKYPDHDHTFNWGSRNNPAGVEYTITVPRNARLDGIELINGALDISGAKGEVRASCVNGRLEAHDLAGRADLSTVNGHLEVKFDHLPNSSIKISSVNGSVSLTIPSDSKADIEASTVSGGIDNDFGLHVDGHFVGHNLRGELGGGGPRIKLENVNGHIEIHHASDGRALSPVKDMIHHDRKSGKDDDDDDDDDDSEI
jgi:DUF4097 and DUF4098 domain-containing protein YvlB